MKRFDWLLLLSALILLALGFVSLYSVGLRDGANYFRKQATMAVIGLVPFAIFYFVNPRWWRKIAWLLYAVNVVILAAVLFVGTSQNGAQRWIDFKFVQFQPSELAKILVVITLASFLAARQQSIAHLSTLVLSFLHVAIPAFLIARQPHYGGAMVLIVIWISLCVAGNVPLRYLAASLILIGLGCVALIEIPGALHGYHLKRLQGLELTDKQGSGFQQDRAQITLGAGGLRGDGLFRGRLSLPEQQNDFVFTVIGEELGLAGGLLTLSAFGFFFYRAWLVMLEATDPYLRMLAAGILGMLGFHTILNLGMVLQILPVVGLWLPFMSAGGTALWLCMACMGLLLKVRSLERPILF